MTAFSSERRALGTCDRCGFDFPLRTLKQESIMGRLQGMRVCRSCWDVDHPQNFLGKVKVFDPQGLKNPRPDLSLDQIRSLPGWNPVGNPAIQITAFVGKAFARVT